MELLNQTLVAPSWNPENAGGMARGAQLRAARALLGWSFAELARRAGLSEATIRRAEAVDGDPPITGRNLGAIVRALEAGGVLFLDDRQQSLSGGSGVRLRRSGPIGGS